MSRRLLAIVAGALAGGLGGALCLLVVYAYHSDIDLELDRSLPSITQGIHPVERDGQRTVAWTEGEAIVSLPGLDRRVPWSCSVALRGARPTGETPPTVTLRVDGVTRARVVAGDQYEPVDLVAPPAPRDGLVLTISSEPAMIRGERVLGAQLDRVHCRPSAGALARAPSRLLLAGAAAAALLGAALGAIGMTSRGAALGSILVAAAQAVPLSRAPAPYTAYPATVLVTACAIAVLLVPAALLLRWRTRRPLTETACFVVAFSGAALYLELIGLFHPMKLVVDALFHANRLEWVLDGRYYFTQPMPSGVEFPYAIALYLFAAPWTYLTTDLVGLLRVVVCSSQALAGALLYPLMVRAWGDRLAAAIAVALLFAAPVPYLTIGYANLTFAFGQSLALATLVASVAWPLGVRHWHRVMGLFVLACAAFLSHVGVFPVLFVTLVAGGLLCLWRGGPSLLVPGRTLILVAALAAAFSIVTYYGHFEEAYATLTRVKAASAAGETPPVSAADVTMTPETPASSPPTRSVPARLLGGLVRSVIAVGWPAALLAAAGVVLLLLRRGQPDRLALVLAGGGVAYVLFFTFASVTPVEARFLKYNDEFIDRLSYLTLPIVAILGARGAAWGWRARGVPRLLMLALGLAAGAIGLRQWLAWLQ